MNKKIKIVFCWSDISGYMAACWRALAAAQNNIEPYVIAFQAKTETAFSGNLMRGIPHFLLDADQRNDFQLILNEIIRQKPDLIVLPGWLHPPYKKLPFSGHFKGVKFIMTMDTPYWGKLKQKVAPLALRQYFNKINKVVVCGERSWQYARHLGFSHEDIYRALYGIDYEFFRTISDERQQQPWPKQFLFVGRYSEVKAVDVLIEAYRNYKKEAGATAWPLLCCGQGTYSKQLEATEGIENMGFIQPDELNEIFLQSGTFILPSRFDPWPLVIVEACAAGLPVVCTEVCGTSVELIRNYFNGLVIPENNAERLTRSLMHIHNNYEKLSMWGKRSTSFAEPYSAKHWVSKWEAIVEDSC